MDLSFPKDDVKKFILYKQLLLNPRMVTGYEGIETVFRCLRSLQYDPQNPCGRSIDLSLQARVDKIKPSDYYKWLYDDKKGIETYDKELCAVPIEDLCLCRGRFPPSRQKKLDKFIMENRSKLNEVLKNVERNGPICSYDLNENTIVNIFWEPTRWSKVALDSLWKMGELVISHREGGRKYFDLPNRVYGDTFIWKENKAGDELKKKQLLRRIKSVGILPKSGTGSGWLGVGTAKEVRPLLEKLIHNGELSEIYIEKSKKAYVIDHSDLELFKGMATIDCKRKVSFLSPIDNLLWDRELIRDIFNFDYKWEAYTPEKFRQYGHYVLPVLYGTDFMGRVEPRYDREDQSLKISGLWLENDRNWSEDLDNAFFDYLEGSFKNYLGASSIEWLCEQPKVMTSD